MEGAGRDRRSNGIGVLGRNTATSGTTKGVEGRVDSSDGYGLSTPDDAKIGGVLDTASSDFTVEAGTTTSADARNVVLGHGSNTIQDSAVGASIGGGGFDDGTTVDPNLASDNYGTVGGGRDNTVGSSDGSPSSAEYATVGGGRGNDATAYTATVAGGLSNTASGETGVVGGGKSNRATNRWSTIAGGRKNDASGSRSTVGGGGFYDATADFGTVAGGGSNTASGSRSTVGGGVSNTASSDYATVPGGDNNEANGVKSFAAGEAAKAEHDGTFVWSNADGTSFSSTAQNQFLIEADGGVGIGTGSPTTPLHVIGFDDGSTADPGAHVALVEGTNDDSNNQILAVKTG